jgi:hypothetical protein
MKAVITTEINGCRLFLNDQGLATDRMDRAAEFRDQTDAQLRAVRENCDPAWHGIRWHGAYLLHNGAIAA